MKNDIRIEGVALTLLLILLVSFVLNALGRFIPLVFPQALDHLGEISYITKTWAVIYAVSGMLIGICIATWLWRRAAADGRAKWTWACLGLFGTVPALVLYFLIPLYEHTMSKVQNSESGRPD